MAGSQVSTSVTIINSLLGFQAISLTEFDTSAESSIAAGSKVEIASAFFTFATDESISGFSSITTGETCYIALTPAGTAGSQTVSAAWVSAAPVWDDAKQGWYTTTSSSIRVVGTATKSGATSCEYEMLLLAHQGGNVLPITTGAPISFSVAAASSVIIPRGIYQAQERSAFITEIYNANTTSWIDSSDQIGGAIISDGVNVRVRNTGVSTQSFTLLRY